MEGLATAARADVTAFVAEFVDSTGARRHGPLSELWATPFERVAPVRSFPSFHGQVNFTGLYYVATMDARAGPQQASRAGPRVGRLPAMVKKSDTDTAACLQAVRRHRDSTSIIGAATQGWNDVTWAEREPLEAS